MANKNERILDYYKAFGLDRSWDEKTLRKELGNAQRKFMKRQNVTYDKEELGQINQTLEILDKAIECLSHPDARKSYDKELDKAYQAGMVNDEAEAQARDALEKAKQFYEKGKIQLAAKFALEAINNKVNDPTAYEILAKCYYDSGDYSASIDTVDKALTVYIDNTYFLWLSARINTIVERYDVAQQRINRMLELDPNSSQAHAEQIHFYMYADKEEVAFQQIDQYVAQNPNDTEFKQETAYNLISFTNTCYLEDEETGSLVIADKESYTKCMTLCQKAYSLYQDEYTQSNLENAQFFGKKEFNSNNSYELKWLWGLGLLSLFLVAEIAAGMHSISDFFSIIILLCIYLVPAILLTIVSFRPYWQINRIYYTGKAGWFETLVVWWGKITVALVKWSFKLMWWLFRFIISFIG